MYINSHQNNHNRDIATDLNDKNESDPSHSRVPLKMDCTALMNHLTMCQHSVSHIMVEENGNSMDDDDNNNMLANRELTMLKLPFSSSPFLTHLHHNDAPPPADDPLSSEEDWYIVVANTPYVASAQLISVPSNDTRYKHLNQIVIPDESRSKPLHIWSTPPSPSATADSSSKSKSNNKKDKRKGAGEIVEVINCKPSILIQKPPTTLIPPLGQEENTHTLSISVVLGTNLNRALSIQLVIESSIILMATKTAVTTKASSITHHVSSSGSNGVDVGNMSHGSSCHGGSIGSGSFGTNIQTTPRTTQGAFEERITYSLCRGAVVDHDDTNDGDVDDISKSNGSCYILEPLPLDQNLTTSTSSNKKKHTSSSSNATAGGDDTSSLTSGIGSTNINNTLGSVTSKDKDTTSSASSVNYHNNTNNNTDNNSKEAVAVPFHPKGGVRSINSYHSYHHQQQGSLQSQQIKNNGMVDGNTNFVWIVYGDGTTVRLPHWAFFPLEDSFQEDSSLMLDSGLYHGYQNCIVRARVISSSSSADGSSRGGKVGGNDGNELDVLPLPGFFPTLLSQPLEYTYSGSRRYSGEEKDGTNIMDKSTAGGDSCEDGDYVIHQHEFYEAISYNNNKNDNNPSSSMSTLSFYTNEDQRFSRTHLYPLNTTSMETDGRMEAFQNILKTGSNVIGGTAAIAKGMLGGVVGAVWGRSSTTPTASNTPSNIRRIHHSNTSLEQHVQGMEIGGTMENNASSSMIGRHDTTIANVTTTSAVTAFLPQLQTDPTSISLSSALFDSPRSIIHATIEPRSGKLLACADNLGRVQLIDLSTKQVVRMWKGFRDAKCYWIQCHYAVFPQKRGGNSDDGNNDALNAVQNVTFLVIHGQVRKVVEIYRTPHGPRVGRINAESDDTQVVQCVVTSKNNDSCTKCFLAQTTNKKFVIEELLPDETDMRQASNTALLKSNNFDSATRDKASNQLLSCEGTVQLQLLKQLLGSKTHIKTDLNAVFVSLENITAISDLNQALDLLAVSDRLEKSMGVVDSSFHTKVLRRVKGQLDRVLTDDLIATSNNPNLKELSHKIDLHFQVLRAYDVLNRFETGNYSDDEHEAEISNPRSPWVAEAISWVKTHEEVMGVSMDSDLHQEKEGTLLFSTFAKACFHDIRGTYARNSKGKPKVHLCDSTRDRKVILAHIFRPLQKDMFTYKTTQQIFEHLGIYDDQYTVLNYYGEWFMSVPGKVALQTTLGIWSPTRRWLQDMIQKYLSSESFEAEKQSGNVIPLGPLHEFCSKASDLPRAFLLALKCFEAISTTTKQLEEQTYGLISKEESVRPWEDLLRKLRMCLLISLRVRDAATSPFPFSVYNVESGDKFSISELIAKDQISLSHKHSDITSFEEACRSNNMVKYPSSIEGDDSEQWKMVQSSCKQRAFFDSSLRSPAKSRVKSEKDSLPLLLFMRHYNNPMELAAHRSIILANMWGKEPKSLHLLKDSVSAMRSLDVNGGEFFNLLASVGVEVWQTHLRPIYRGILFGFDDVHEVSEDVVAPLCVDSGWLQSLIKTSLTIIELLEHALADEYLDPSIDLRSENNFYRQGWPTRQEDFILKQYYSKIRNIAKSSVETHRGALLAIQLCEDLTTLPSCIESYDYLFLRDSFYHDLQHSSIENTDHQRDFISIAVRHLASSLQGPTVNQNDVNGIVTLGNFWDIEKGTILSQFLLAMYELGKDDMVQDLTNSTQRFLDLEMFVTGGIALSCVRLNAAITGLKKTKKYRSVLAMLDADTCQWVREEADKALEDDPDLIITEIDGKLLPMEITHGLILQMMRMTVMNQSQTHALSIMSGTLLKALEQHDGTVFAIE